MRELPIRHARCKKPSPEAGFAQDEANFPAKTLEAMWISYYGFKINQCQKDTVSPTMNWAGAAGHLNLREKDLPAGGIDQHLVGMGNGSGCQRLGSVPIPIPSA